MGKPKYLITGCYYCGTREIIRHKRVVYYPPTFYMDRMERVEIILNVEFTFCPNTKCLGYIDYTTEYHDPFTGERSYWTI